MQQIIKLEVALSHLTLIGDKTDDGFVNVIVHPLLLPQVSPPLMDNTE